MYVDKKSTKFHGPNMLKNERIPLTARQDLPELCSRMFMRSCITRKNQKRRSCHKKKRAHLLIGATACPPETAELPEAQGKIQPD